MSHFYYRRDHAGFFFRNSPLKAEPLELSEAWRPVVSQSRRATLYPGYPGTRGYLGTRDLAGYPPGARQVPARYPPGTRLLSTRDRRSGV
eukprot:1759169-Rhodomonas_salina.1